jgi:hypothetical protein
MSEGGEARYAELAERATADALGGIRDGEGDDVSAALSLALAAWNAVMGVADADTLAGLDEYSLTDDGGYEYDPPRECICPPDLLAAGGFKGRCPTHGSA